MSDILKFTADDFRARAHKDRPPFSSENHGDHALNPDLFATLESRQLRDAAVLVPIIDSGKDAKVILTQRAEKLRTHSGQVAFPGGVVDPEDANVEAAAKREAFEEIGLDYNYVEPVGRLPTYMTFTGFKITPILAVVREGFTLKINPDEVDDAFCVPLSFLMDPSNHIKTSREFEGRERFYYSMPYENRKIWGVTAGIVRTLYERLYL